MCCFLSILLFFFVVRTNNVIKEFKVKFSKWDLQFLLGVWVPLPLFIKKSLSVFNILAGSSFSFRRFDWFHAFFYGLLRINDLITKRNKFIILSEKPHSYLCHKTIKAHFLLVYLRINHLECWVDTTKVYKPQAEEKYQIT